LPGGKHISDLLLELYGFSAGCDFFEHTLDVLSRYVPAAISTYAFTDLKTGVIDQKRVRKQNRHMSQDDLAEVSRLLQSHPFTTYYIRNMGGPVLATEDILSMQEWLQSETYNELHRPHGVVYDTSVRFYTGSLCVIFAFVDTDPLSKKHVRLLNLIAPHLGTAFRSFSLQNKGLEERLPEHLILLNSAGTPRHLNPETEELLKTYFPHEKKRVGRHLPADVENWIQLQMASIKKGCAPDKFAVRNDCGALVFSMIPFAYGWILSINEVMAPSSVDVFMGMGLTRREAEVLSWVVQGKQNEDIGNIHRISKQTVRKHVENILHKLHCETRGAAAMLAMHALTERTHGVSFDPAFA